MNVPQAKHVEIELVSILVLLMTHAAPLPNVVWPITKQNVDVLQALLETPTLCVFQVRIDIELILMGHFLLKTVFVVKRGECQHDTECPDNKACINNQCLDPCTLHHPCGKNAECETRGHRPVCRCPSGWAGDPHTECYTCRFSILEKKVRLCKFLIISPFFI